MPRPRHPWFAFTALILGGVGIGTTEFVTMGLLPQIAEGVGVSIPEAGHTISAYALGVVVGAPLIAALGARLPRKGLLIGLMAAFAVGNVLSALAPTYETLFAARVLAGLPHGAFFGLAALVAVDLVPAGRSGRAVGTVMLGIPIANILGVPGATWLGQQAGWRAAYWLVALVGVVTVGLVAASIPRLTADRSRTVRSELAALGNVQVMLTLGVAAIGFGGMFAMYSYIAPTITEVTGLSEGAVPLYLLVFGVAGLVGNMVAGRMGDWSVLRSVVIGMVGLGVSLGLFALVAGSAVGVAVVLVAASVLASVLVINLQLRLMQVAGKAQTLAAAGNHAALNLANALGAWVGGLVIAAGYGYRAPAVVGVGFAALGLGVLWLSVHLHRRDVRARAQAPVEPAPEVPAAV
ncbi:MFS transporter [Phycicoccus sp. BSK3Z-2]|uniref:MFS transporter n=1 Tax=Phycicoccus avicenniae TaxID=2828860 RepID=A0A941I278_9MICO|nr:MFS transporter [Phycicoccus avicenniae]MBR7744754.1 MFS transporter [Phycicoccus avicenniae]